MAIAQCYATCADRWEKSRLQWSEASVATLSVSLELIALATLAGEEQFVAAVGAAAEEEACELAQNFAQAVETCRAGCIDIETAYDFRGSSARSHHSRIRTEALREVRAARLWISPSETPRRGTEAFAAACQRYINGGYDGLFLEGASPVGPRLTGVALDGLRRAAESGKLVPASDKPKAAGTD